LLPQHGCFEREGSSPHGDDPVEELQIHELLATSVFDVLALASALDDLVKETGCEQRTLGSQAGRTLHLRAAFSLLS
jgi:hypothetical protein